jgi:formiminotetrahydrofolate cyclodeaminase
MPGGRAGTALARSATSDSVGTSRGHRTSLLGTYNPLVPETTRATSFRDLRLGDFVDELASSSPVPGGGSASAVAASLGAALVAMVASLSEGRPKYAQHAELHEASKAIGRRLTGRFLDLADDDSEAYGVFSGAMKLPRETETDRASRRQALSEAARGAAEVPLATVEACLELLAAVETLVGRSNVNAASDLDVAALLGEAAARGAAANVLINLPSVDDESYVGETTARVMGLVDSIEELAAAVHSAVRSGETRDPVPA